MNYLKLVTSSDDIHHDDILIHGTNKADYIWIKEKNISKSTPLIQVVNHSPERAGKPRTYRTTEESLMSVHKDLIHVNDFTLADLIRKEIKKRLE